MSAKVRENTVSFDQARQITVHVHARIAPQIILRGSTWASDCVLSCVRRQVLISLGYGQDMQVREKSHRFTFDTWLKSRSVVIFVSLCFPDSFVSSTVLAKLMLIRLPCFWGRWCWHLVSNSWMHVDFQCTQGKPGKSQRGECHECHFPQIEFF